LRWAIIARRGNNDRPALNSRLTGPRKGFGNQRLLNCASMAHPVTAIDENTPLGRIHELANGLCRMLRMARGLTEGGRRIDIAGLDRLVGLVCAKSLDLPPEDGRRMRVTLIELRDEADALTAALRGRATAPPTATEPGA
jgi:hypothetical protein